MMETAPVERRTKSASAFLTISEVSSALNIPQHILRFWEPKFPHLRPLKRAGGRRYFRPEDIALLETINRLLSQDGYTIRGVQKLMREGEIKRNLPRFEEASLPLGLEALDQPAPAFSSESNKVPAIAKTFGVLRLPLDQRSRAALHAVLDELVEIKKILAR